MTHIFISDLHLSPHKPELSKMFTTFLSQYSGSGYNVYILGDLFDIWIGDDYSMQFYQNEISALKNCHAEGTRLFFMHGNRDFLIRDEFVASTGGELLTDPTIIELQGVPTLLTHGDQLCTDDIGYQQMRSIIQNPNWINDFLAKPVEERLQLADNVRKQSREAGKLKSDEIMDTNQQAVESFMAEHGVTQLIHGHTHRPNKHEFQLNGSLATRWVLGDWHADHAQYLVVSDEGISLSKFSA